jgi:hypothetical protein
MSGKSFYIHAVDKSLTEESIKSMFLSNGIGIVSRVDFTQIGQTGFNEYTPTPMRYKSVFVYFKSFIDSELSLEIRENLESGYKFYVTKKTYWLLLPNKRPIPNTQMNIHQVVDHARQLEEKVEQQTRELVVVKGLLYHLVSGLFNAQTQRGILNAHLAHLGFPIEETLTNRSIWDSTPTTRQGDANEQRIAYLEQVVSQLWQVKAPVAEDDETETLTYSSIPSLLDDELEQDDKLEGEQVDTREEEEEVKEEE